MLMYYRHTYRLIKNEKIFDDTSMFLLHKKAISNYLIRSNSQSNTKEEGTFIHESPINLSLFTIEYSQYMTILEPSKNKNKCLWHKN